MVNMKVNNKYRELPLLSVVVVVVVASLLVLTRGTEARRGWSQPAANKAITTESGIKDERPLYGAANLFDREDEEASRPDENSNGESRISGNKHAPLFPWIATLHSNTSDPIDRKFCGPGIMVGPGRMLVHAGPLLRVAHHESEHGYQVPPNSHLADLTWPALGSFNDNIEPGSHAISYRLVATIYSLFLLRTSHLKEKDNYPSPSELPTFASEDDNIKDGCFVYGWDEGSRCGKIPTRHQRKFVGISVRVKECCGEMCSITANKALEEGVCFGQADLGSPILCKGKLSYIVTHIPVSRGVVGTFEAHKAATIMGFVNILNPTRGNHHNNSTGYHPKFASCANGGPKKQWA